MIFPRFLFVTLLGLGSAWADDSDSSIPGQMAADHALAAAPAGPFLSPPPASEDEGPVVNSSELVPPVSYAAGAVPMPLPPPEAPASAPAPASETAPSENATVNLIRLMVKKGLITKEDAGDLVKQAQAEADGAHRQALAAKPKSEVPPQATGPDGILSAPAAAAPSSPVGEAASDDTVQVSYVPDVVKNQIRDEVKADVMKQAREEHWGTKNDIPDWVHRFRVTGDIRVRYEDDAFPDGNATGSLVNYNAINTGAPFDANFATSKSGFLPTYNVDQDRSRFRLRARIGAEIDLGQGFTAGMRVGTGSDNSPVTENQTLGAANGGQGGNFSKYQIWLDRAFIRYELGARTDKDFSVSIGRFDNPFLSTSMIWADDIAFDGVMAQGKYQVMDGVTPFLTAGAFPVFNTDLNFGTNSSVAGNGYQSEDKYLIAAQGGTSWIINKYLTFKGAIAYYDFENIQGQVSDPISQDAFAALGTNVNGNTDDSRPSFAQHGNTYIALRNVDLDPNLTTPAPVYEYYGLAAKFHELALTGQLDYSYFDPFHLSLIGEFVDNVAFDKNAIENEGPAILPGPQNNNNSAGAFAGGGMGYNVRLTVGKAVLEKLWDWNVNLTYRYLESDAVVDAFDDADFGGYLTGTNLKGYIIGANLALSPRIWTSVRFLSADSIAGPPLRTDTFQFDINAKF
jgi:hypothetical protein